MTVRVSARLVSEPLDPASLWRDPPPSDGAVLVFTGVVRDHNDGRPVRGLRYDAYREMAVGVLEEIALDAAERFRAGEVWVAHRTGELEVGEVSVCVRVSAPHRDACYGASRHVIEEIKRRLPVWKKERYADGGAEWLEGTDPRSSLAGGPG